MAKVRLNTTSNKVQSSKSSAMSNRYLSPIAATVHKTAVELYESGKLSKQAMREFDGLCLAPTKPMASARIAVIRKKEIRLVARNGMNRC